VDVKALSQSDRDIKDKADAYPYYEQRLLAVKWPIFGSQKKRTSAVVAHFFILSETVRIPHPRVGVPWV
jgi:hypothetical protein